MSSFLFDLAAKQERANGRCITSVCSANPYVLRSALQLHRELDTIALIEATSNQVNQFGGYTGMRPVQFKKMVLSIARETGFPQKNLILGGDHLGPYPWRSETAHDAMDKACRLVFDYAQAGYTKIHLDASMPLRDDATNDRGELDTAIGAERAARLCQAAESGRVPGADAPAYVIGTEVPAPGGVSGELKAPEVTRASAVKDTVECTRHAFHLCDLDEAWNRVIAVVVQPGVEFTDKQVFEYNKPYAAELRMALPEDKPMVFEGHSTDYQLPEHLRAMTEDSFAILKVGPALTFAFREAVFLLGCIESSLVQSGVKLSQTRVPKVLEDAMRANPEHWEKFYKQDTDCLSFDLLYSLSDRCRYYWSVPEVDRELKKLIENMQKHWPPMQLSRQFFPNQYWKVRRGLLEDNPQDFITDRIQEVLRTYPDLS